MSRDKALLLKGSFGSLHERENETMKNIIEKRKQRMREKYNYDVNSYGEVSL